MNQPLIYSPYIPAESVVKDDYDYSPCHISIEGGIESSPDDSITESPYANVPTYTFPSAGSYKLKVHVMPEPSYTDDADDASPTAASMYNRDAVEEDDSYQAVVKVESGDLTVEDSKGKSGCEGKSSVTEKKGNKPAPDYDGVVNVKGDGVLTVGYARSFGTVVVCGVNVKVKDNGVASSSSEGETNQASSQVDEALSKLKDSQPSSLTNKGTEKKATKVKNVPVEIITKDHPASQFNLMNYGYGLCVMLIVSVVAVMGATGFFSRSERRGFKNN
jgi:hypothetical protein